MIVSFTQISGEPRAASQDSVESAGKIEQNASRKFGSHKVGSWIPITSRRELNDLPPLQPTSWQELDPALIFPIASGLIKYGMSKLFRI